LPGVTHDHVDAGGLRMHVALAGEQDAPPLLMVHGWPQHWYCWRHVIGPLAKRYRVIAPDLRGHGWTEAPRDGYAKAQLADDLIALLDALGIDRVTWLGHDWGGFAGWLAAFDHADRVERLVACCIPPIMSRDRSLRALLTMLSYQAPISTPILGPLLVRRGLTEKVLRVARVKGEWTDEEIRIYDDVLRARPHVTVAMYLTFLLRELPKLAGGPYADRELTVPATSLVGDRDRITNSVTAETYPEIEVRRIDGVGHFLPEEDPDAVLAEFS
jgi:pimeloyl-ACP methyl ester carboxylesterase